MFDVLYLLFFLTKRSRLLWAHNRIIVGKNLLVREMRLEPGSFFGFFVKSYWFPVRWVLTVPRGGSRVSRPEPSLSKGGIGHVNQSVWKRKLSSTVTPRMKDMDYYDLVVKDSRLYSSGIVVIAPRQARPRPLRARSRTCSGSTHWDHPYSQVVGVPWTSSYFSSSPLSSIFPCALIPAHQ